MTMYTLQHGFLTQKVQEMEAMITLLYTFTLYKEQKHATDGRMFLIRKNAEARSEQSRENR